jgi:hypothetical protein
MFTIHADLTLRGLSELYPARCIHSVYFETRDFQMLANAEEGVLPRKKIRIRNYPDKNPERRFLETKISSIEGRYKTSEEINRDKYEFYTSNGILDSQYGTCYPLMEVKYTRHYCLLDKTRITFDSDISYSGFNSQIFQADNWCVIEIKAPADTSIDFLERLVAIPRRRFSKFSNGMLWFHSKQQFA